MTTEAADRAPAPAQLPLALHQLVVDRFHAVRRLFVQTPQINGGSVAAHGLVLFECHRFDHRPDETADQHARRTPVAESQFHGDGAMRHGLCGRHLAPEARAVGAQMRQPLFQLLHSLRLPEVFHGGDRPREDGI